MRELVSRPIAGVAVNDWSVGGLRSHVRGAIEACGERIDEATWRPAIESHTAMGLLFGAKESRLMECEPGCPERSEPATETETESSPAVT